MAAQGWARSWGSVLEVLECRVGLEGLPEHLPTLGTEAVVRKTANTDHAVVRGH